MMLFLLKLSTYSFIPIWTHDFLFYSMGSKLTYTFCLPQPWKKLFLTDLFFWEMVFRNGEILALAGVAQWTECGPANHMPGLQARSPVGAV